MAPRESRGLARIGHGREGSRHSRQHRSRDALRHQGEGSAARCAFALRTGPLDEGGRCSGLAEPGESPGRRGGSRLRPGLRSPGRPFRRPARRPEKGRLARALCPARTGQEVHDFRGDRPGVHDGRRARPPIPRLPRAILGRWNPRRPREGLRGARSSHDGQRSRLCLAGGIRREAVLRESRRSRIQRSGTGGRRYPWRQGGTGGRGQEPRIGSGLFRCHRAPDQR
ncbi:MAG: hypothetical protein BWX47_01603 [candidate division Hyd24-12 bacterium ADurb.Bin004]|nr:MAG: hypothetical protein BWX47_01603 [candidate division Hyd24-12 bacterium ADurb.Bin004]